MTTIITDGKKIASDTQGDCGGIIESGHHNKVIEYKGKVFALCGALAYLPPLAKWYVAGADPDKMPCGDKSFSVLNYTFWAFDDGKLFEFNNILPYPVECFAPASIGTGREIAMAVLECGLGPDEAVRKAMKLDVATGGEVRVLELPQHLQITHGKPGIIEQAEAPVNGTLPEWVTSE